MLKVIFEKLIKPSHKKCHLAPGIYAIWLVPNMYKFLFYMKTILVNI